MFRMFKPRKTVKVETIAKSETVTVGCGSVIVRRNRYGTSIMRGRDMITLMDDQEVTHLVECLREVGYKITMED